MSDNEVVAGTRDAPTVLEESTQKLQKCTVCTRCSDLQNLFTLHNVAQVAAPRSKFALPPSGAAAAILAQPATMERRCFTLKVGKNCFHVGHNDKSFIPATDSGSSGKLKWAV